MTDLEEIKAAVLEGRISPDDAVNAFETPAQHISAIPINNLVVDVLPCGFPSLDDFMVFKRNRGELLIFGARPSMGKSAFMFQIAKYVAQTENVLVFSLEMDTESIKARMLSETSGRGLSNIQKGQVKFEHLEAANNTLNKLKLFIDDRSGLDVRTIRSSALAHHARYPLSLVVVDYLQLVKTRERQSRNEEVGDVSAELKALAKDLKCPVLVASQLNRECERRGKLSGDYKPILSDLRDSGNIEQDADAILFLSREGVINTNVSKDQTEVGVAKARNGQTGWFNFRFYDAKVAFEDLKRPLMATRKDEPQRPEFSRKRPTVVQDDDF